MHSLDVICIALLSLLNLCFGLCCIALLCFALLTIAAHRFAGLCFAFLRHASPCFAWPCLASLWNSLVCFVTVFIALLVLLCFATRASLRYTWLCLASPCLALFILHGFVCQGLCGILKARGASNARPRCDERKQECDKCKWAGVNQAWRWES